MERFGKNHEFHVRNLADYLAAVLGYRALFLLLHFCYVSSGDNIVTRRLSGQSAVICPTYTGIGLISLWLYKENGKLLD
jgi:hypothetical protein